MDNAREELLRVEHLCQYFGSTKAVDDVSFGVKKGEVFGLVGESGCGKTTTGRSIIKLYDITSGDIYFDGVRIAAGTLSYRRAIRRAVDEYREKSKDESEEVRRELKKQRDEIIPNSVGRSVSPAMTSAIATETIRENRSDLWTKSTVPCWKKQRKRNFPP